MSLEDELNSVEQKYFGSDLSVDNADPISSSSSEEEYEEEGTNSGSVKLLSLTPSTGKFPATRFNTVSLQHANENEF